MKFILSSVFLALFVFSASAPVLASKASNRAVTACKAEAKSKFATENGYKSRKVHRIKEKPSYTNISFMVYPEAADKFKAVCSVSRKSGEITSFDRQTSS